MKNDNFKIGDKISASIKYIIIDKYDGKITLELSRTSINFLVALLKLNVPEIEDGIVIIHSVARIPGEKAKVAVSSNNPRIDPISAVIGVRGRRVHEISRELNSEIIDCISYSSIPELYIRNSLSPAKINNVKVKLNNDDEVENKQFIGVATVKIEQNERGKAIGKNGINLKLTRMLTGFDIELITIEKKDTKESEENSSRNQSNNKINFSPKVEIEERRKSVSEKLGALFN
jgi:N utilization substance protein A